MYSLDILIPAHFVTYRTLKRGFLTVIFYPSHGSSNHQITNCIRCKYIQFNFLTS
jgi:hypothetical protein